MVSKVLAEKRAVFVLGSFVAACSAKVERLLRPGEPLSARDFTLEPGGKGFDLAAGARRLGAVWACCKPCRTGPSSNISLCAVHVR